MGEYDSKPKPKSEPIFPAAAPAPAPKPKPTPDPKGRINRFPRAVDLGQAIVGSSHKYPLVTPKLKSNIPAVATVSIAPAATNMSRSSVAEEVGDLRNERRRMAAFSPTDANERVVDGRPIPVRFWPEFPGDHAADVNVLVQWNDGAQELQTVRVDANARRLAHAPMNSVDGGVEPGVGKREKPQVPDLQNVPALHKDRLEREFKLAAENARHLAANQKQGAEDAGKQAGGYERRPEDDAWGALVEIAILSGVAGVAGLVAKSTLMFLSPRLHALKAFAKFDEKKFEKIVDGLIGDSIKESLKSGAKAADVQKALRETPKHTPVGLDEFFGRQMAALEQLQHQNALAVIDRQTELQHMLLTAPDAAVAIMESLGQAFGAVAAKAIEIQRVQSTLAWGSHVGQAENKTSRVRVNGEHRSTTNLTNATGATRGVLRIRVVDGVVRSASIDGVTRQVAGELLGVQLSTAAIPIVMLVGDPESHFITRDEVGRVRLPFSSSEREANEHRDNQKLVESVLSRSLLQWGVDQIATDDVGKKS